ncbi:MAG: sigma-70 family RNA polymerase sigma factor [Clostridia bacterium]|nr:sigma-70 family RNA polymerase sigma factor [Clostridia bacterium]
MKNDMVLFLYDLYADRIYKLAYSFLGSGADAEDIVQNVFIKLLKQNVHITEGKEGSYLLRMAANACKDHLRSLRSHGVVPFDDLLEKSAGSAFSDEEKDLIRAVEKLPYKQRAVIHLYYYEGYSVKEISEILGISVSGVTMRLTRARNQLKDTISKEVFQS